MTDTQTTPTATAGSIEALRLLLSAVLAKIEAVPGEISEAMTHARDPPRVRRGALRPDEKRREGRTRPRERRSP
jgi:hypothetical protein